MLSADRALARTRLAGPPVMRLLLAAPGGLVAQGFLSGEAIDREARAPELAPVATRDILRLVAFIAVGVTVWLSIADIFTLAFYGRRPESLSRGFMLAAVTVPLHVRHLIYGVRGERPPWGYWTLAVLAVFTIGGVYVADYAWCREFTPLAVSILIVIPGWRGVALAAVVALLPLVLFEPMWYTDANTRLPSIYLSAVVVWRSTTQFLPLRLCAALRALDAASRALEARAVIQTRVRIDTDLRRGVGAVLQEIVARGERARTIAATDPARAGVELRLLVAESRRALADARRTVAGYRAASVRAELDAAAALLEAAGASVHVVTDGRVTLDAPDEHARRVIRAALADVLRSEPRRAYRVEVARDGSGRINVRIGPEQPGAREAAEVDVPNDARGDS